jgi:hypothetical protein
MAAKSEYFKSPLLQLEPFMCAHHDKPEGGYQMNGVALSILIMGISLAIVIVLWVWFGYIGPKFSNDVMREQQKELRQQYGFAPAPEITEEQARVPPSLRNLS